MGKPKGEDAASDEMFWKADVTPGLRRSQHKEDLRWWRKVLGGVGEVDMSLFTQGWWMSLQETEGALGGCGAGARCAVWVARQRSMKTTTVGIAVVDWLPERQAVSLNSTRPFVRNISRWI